MIEQYECLDFFNQNRFMNNIVIFEEKDHKYFFLEKEDRTPFQSVSGVFSNLEPEKDWEFIASRKVLKENIPEKEYKKVTKKYGWDNRDILEPLIEIMGKEGFDKKYKEKRTKWSDNNKKATTRGTAFHSLMEKKDYDRGHVLNPLDGEKYEVKVLPKEYDNQSVRDLCELEDGCYLELLVFNKELKLAGQVDKMFIKTIDGKRYVDIDDWKTNKKIFKKPDFRHPKKGFPMLNTPCNHLYETNYNIYMIKISIYAYLMELAGFTVRDLRFTHVEIDDDLNILNTIVYPLFYKKWEVEEILDRYAGK